VLTYPKHTGHMVWNRHARKSGYNRAKPIRDWIGSRLVEAGGCPSAAPRTSGKVHGAPRRYLF